jgi:hypothetical protein
MIETVTVTPNNGLDGDGNPVAAGAPVTVSTLAVAPGNTVLQYGIGGDLDDVVFTVYLELGSAVADDDVITVRGKQCRARVQEWISPWTGRGGLAVLARSTTGRGA